ncbi:MAG: hypothetical protein R2838_13055 [Caldilineaceae bacterium]
MNWSEIARRLVAWHAEHQRVLPWRDTPPGARDPYAVWVSEIMAQQTRLEVVVDYFQRWMARFPTVHAWPADQQDVLKQWEGLGYYARARNLHKAAQQVVAGRGGVFPDDRAGWLALPGVGEYTVGAILSMAFNRPEPILDGNVKRVLARLADIDTPVNATATVRTLWDLARRWWMRRRLSTQAPATKRSWNWARPSAHPLRPAASSAPGRHVHGPGQRHPTSAPGQGAAQADAALRRRRRRDLAGCAPRLALAHRPAPA